jgi:hypothetical protein
LKNELTLNGWWFDIGNADVYAFSESQEQFVLLSDDRAKSRLQKLGDQNFAPPLWLESLRKDELVEEQ